MQRRRSRRKNRRRFWLAVEAGCIALLIVLAAMIAHRLVASERIASEEDASAAVMQKITENIQPELEAAVPVIRAEFAELMEQNPDTVGLLHFDGDRTLYVCQAEDNVYYMTHRFDGSEDPAGMIYMDCRCSLSPRSDNLILYGHNMADGSRFGTLKRFQSVDHLLENPTFTFADLYQTVDYVPFAIFTTTVLTDDSAYFDFAQADFPTEADFDAYVAGVRERSEYYLPDVPAYGDHLLTLATCASDHERGRLVIVCYAKGQAFQTSMNSLNGW